MRKSFLFVALAALALVGCNDKTQSELTQEDLGLTGEAKISVQIRYNPGVHKVGGAYADVPLPLPDDAVVYALVNYKEYISNDPADPAKVNFKQFKAEAEKKDNGDVFYNVTVPAGERQIEVEMVVNGFYGEFYANPDAEAITVYYPEMRLPKFKVLGGQEIVKSDPAETIIGAPEKALNPSQNFGPIAVSGKLQGMQEYWDKDAKSPNEVKTDNMGLAGRVVVLEIKAANPDNDPRVLQFKSAATGADGKFSFSDVKVFDQWVDSLKANADYLKMNLIVEPWVANFDHYYKELNTKTLKDEWTAKSFFDKAKSDQADPAVNTEGLIWEDWLNRYFYNDGDKLPYFYTYPGASKTQAVPGYWEAGKSDTTAIANVRAAIVLFQEAEQNISAKFAPKDASLKSINGVGYFGGKEEITLSDDNKIEMPKMSYNNLMGWKAE